MMSLLRSLCSVVALAGTAAMEAAPTTRVFVRMSRLAGGPSVLRLHSSVFVEEASSSSSLVGFDFLPVDAANPAVVARLLSLRSAPGVVREMRLDEGRGLIDVGERLVSIDELRAAATSQSTDLHLLSNQCWSHSLALATKATRRDPLAIALDVLRGFFFFDHLDDDKDDGRRRLKDTTRGGLPLT